MKKISSALRVNLAQYRELAVLSQFGSDLDKATELKLAQGRILLETLKQDQYAPYPVEDQVILLYIAANGHLIDVPPNEIRSFNRNFLNYIKSNYSQLIQSIQSTGNLTPDAEETLINAVKEYIEIHYPKTT